MNTPYRKKTFRRGELFKPAPTFALVATALIALTFELHAALGTVTTKPAHSLTVDPALAAQLSVVEKLPTVAADTVPRTADAIFYSAQCPYWPPLPGNDVIAPSRVQVLADAAGQIISAVLLETSGSATADAKALELARNARFAPAAQMTFGEMIFNWHTLPANAKPSTTLP